MAPPKRGRSSGNGSTRGPNDALPPLCAQSTRSGRLVAVGMQLNGAINCAGMALMRVFQGHVEVLGWQPALATYYPVHSPKWSSLLVIEARSRDAAISSTAVGSDAVQAKTKRQTHAAESQGEFTEACAALLAKMEPHAALDLNMEEEHEADRLAREMSENYAVVIIFRAMRVTFGNVMCYYEVPGKDDVALPGFKIIVTKEAFQALTSATDSASHSHQSGHAAKHSHQILSEVAVADPSRVIQISHGWNATVTNLERSLLAGDAPQRIVVCGGKDVGKSTYCRYLINRLLSYYQVVAFLDTDVGQPELTPPGVVSLHLLATPLLGPGFTHMKHPLRSFFCGGSNPGLDPLSYLTAVKALLQLAAQHDVPLVVNTDGWVKSMGHDLLCSVIQDADPHHVVQLLSTTRSKQFDVPTTGNWRVQTVDPWDPGMSIVQAPRSSKEMRVYRLHSYFLSREYVTLPRTQLQNLHFITEKDRLSHQIALAYSAAKPFAVSFDGVDVAFAGSPVPSSQVLASLNCSIVGLCINARRQPLTSDDTSVPRIESQPVASAPCVGVGFVRSVDVDRRLLFILSPVPARVLTHVNLLVRGTIAIDQLIIGLDGFTPAPYVVTDVIASDGTGSGAMQSRNNIKRKRDAK